MAGCISGKQYWRVCDWRFPKHFPLLLKAERGTLCCTVVHQACFFHFPLICYCTLRSSRALRAVLLGALSSALLIAGNFLLLARSGSLFINVCDVNVCRNTCGVFFPSANVEGLYSVYLCAQMCFYGAIKNITFLTGVTVHLSSHLGIIAQLWKVKALWLV